MGRPPLWRRLLDPVVVAVVVVAVAEPLVAISYRYRTELAGRFALGGPLLGLLVVAFGVLAIVLWRRPDLDERRAAFVVGALVLATMSHTAWMDLLLPSAPNAARLVVWVALTTLVGWGVWRLSRHAAVRWFIGLFVGFLLLGQAVGIVGYRLELAGATPAADVDPLPPVGEAPPERPDVYWFVLDAHARPDLARSLLDADPSPFVERLEANGFDVADDSWASYMRTYLSVASTLSMGYPFEPGANLRNEYHASLPLFVDDNATFRRFRAMGYEIAYAPAGAPSWSGCGDGADLCAAHGGGPLHVDELVNQVAGGTPLGSFDVVDLIQTDPASALAEIDAMRTPGRPLFAFVHVLSPHGPSRYGPGCEQLEHTSGRFGLDEVSEQRSAYRIDLECIDAVMAATVDAVVARDPDAVIVIQGDHGTKLDNTWDPAAEWSDEDLVERLATFSAVRLPPACRRDDPRAQLLVNTFRVVFACLEGREVELLDYRAFVSDYGEIDGMIELALDRDTVRLGPSSDPG